MCTSDAVRGGFCSASDLGRFILDLPSGLSIENTTFWSARVAFPDSESGSSNTTDQGLQSRQAAANPNPSPSGLLVYQEPIQYLVRKTGYYCVGMSVFRMLSCGDSRHFSSAVVPVTVLQTSSRSTLQSRQSSDVHPSYRGTVLFRNVFDGQLPATDYPKVNVCGHYVHPPYYMTHFHSFTSSCSSYTLRWQLPGVGYVISMLPKFFQYR